MDVMLKKNLISGLKSLIKKINSGWCDNATSEQYEKLMNAFDTLLEVDLEIKPVKNKKQWRIFQYFGKH